jgi:KaiC/GvpD/RAD55 family RecA-like ATPase
VSSTTTILVSQQEGQRGIAEYALVDGVIALRNVRVGLRSVRELEVQTFRGELYLEGAHFF